MQSCPPETIEVLRVRLQQQDYYSATSLLTNSLRRWGYVQAAELFKQAGGNELAPSIWQAAIASLRSGPEANIVGEILQSPFGCHFMTVAAGRNAKIPPYTYSIGLWHNFWHPEMICLGLPSPVALQVLGFYSEQIAKGKPPQTDVELCGAITGDTPIQFKVCRTDAKSDYMHWASWFNSTLDYPAIQLIWQDKGHHWPWHAEFSPDQVQPLLIRDEHSDEHSKDGG